MTEEEYKKRKTVSYPPTPVKKMLQAYKQETGESESSFVTDAIKEKLNRLPEGLREQIKKISILL